MADTLDVNEIFRRAVEANVKFYQGWLDLSLEYLRGMSEIFLTPQDSGSTADAGADAGVLVLEGEEGSTVRSAFLVTNDLERKVSCRLVASAFTDPDGTSVPAKVSFQPAKLDLKPGERQVVQAEVSIDRKLAAGLGYQGEFAIDGMDGFSVPVVLRRRHRIEDAVVEPAQSGGEPAAGKPGAPKTPRKKPPQKKARKKAPRKRMAKQKG
jgi:hypothetical protein